GDTVTVRLRHGDRRLLVSVIDTGSGIAPGDLPFVFDRFYRSPTQPGDRRDRHKGVGLGLAITRRIAELHGGQLLVESALGVGSTFTFSLEVAPLTYQLSTAELQRLRPTRLPPNFPRSTPSPGRDGELRVRTEPIG
ncbi:MAG: sensor histidine kinase, partial [Acidobacteriota bacterium]